MSERKTIPKNRVAQFLLKVTSAKSYTLDNYFRGEPYKDLDHLRQWAVKMDGRVRIHPATHTGEVYYHSNHWVEFTYAA